MAQASTAVPRWAALLLTLFLTSADLAAPHRPRMARTMRMRRDLDTLVAPIALFPDPLLAAVMQASVVPLDVVQAARFLDDYAKDPTKTPDADWDPAVRGLLAFPTVLNGMNEHLDWVQAMGDAVTQRLPDVQDSIQQVRAEFYAGGVLKSDDKQIVEVDSEIIRVTPVDPNQIFVPVYDPQALVDAVEASNNAAPTAEPTESGPSPVPVATPPAEPEPQRRRRQRPRPHARRAQPAANRRPHRRPHAGREAAAIEQARRRPRRSPWRPDHLRGARHLCGAGRLSGRDQHHQLLVARRRRICGRRPGRRHSRLRDRRRRRQ